MFFRYEDGMLHVSMIQQRRRNLIDNATGILKVDPSRRDDYIAHYR